MADGTNRIVFNVDFETALGDVSRRIRDEGLETIARIDLRNCFWRHLGRNCRNYFLIETWPPESALQALEDDPAVGAGLPISIAVYEIAPLETGVAVHAPAFGDQADRAARLVAGLEADARRAVPRVV